MSDDDHLPAAVTAFLALCALLAGLLIGTWLTDSAWRRDAVEKGYGEWVMDPKTGNTAWRWKP